MSFQSNQKLFSLIISAIPELSDERQKLLLDNPHLLRSLLRPLSEQECFFELNTGFSWGRTTALTAMGPRGSYEEIMRACGYDSNDAWQRMLFAIRGVDNGILAESFATTLEIIRSQHNLDEPNEEACQEFDSFLEELSEHNADVFHQQDQFVSSSEIWPVLVDKYDLGLQKDEDNALKKAHELNLSPCTLQVMLEFVCSFSEEITTENPLHFVTEPFGDYVGWEAFRIFGEDVVGFRPTTSYRTGSAFTRQSKWVFVQEGVCDE